MDHSERTAAQGGLEASGLGAPLQPPSAAREVRAIATRIDGKRTDSSVTPRRRAQWLTGTKARRGAARFATGVAHAMVLLVGGAAGLLLLITGVIFSRAIGWFLPDAWQDAWRATTPDVGTLAWMLAIGGAVGLWWFVRMVLRRDASAGLLVRVQARPRHCGNRVEQDLGELVEEIAGAAHVPTPRIWIFEGEALNAAVLGRNADCAALLISRRMLDELTPEQVFGVLAHLVAMIGNGDLPLTHAILRMRCSFALAQMVFETPFDARARVASSGVVRYLARSSHHRDRDQAKVGAATLEQLRSGESTTLAERFRVGWAEGANPFRKVVCAAAWFACAPLVVARVLAYAVFNCMDRFCARPWGAWVLRARRRVADSTAAELLGESGSLSSALEKLARHTHSVPQAGWAELLFIVAATEDPAFESEQKPAGTHIRRLRTHPPLSERIAALAAEK